MSNEKADLVCEQCGITFTTQQDRGIQPEHMVNLIVVNNRYHISKVGYGGYREPGQPFQHWGTMQFFRRTRFIGGSV
jgi:hypothetical protein